jgi:hypothetical protein
VALPVLFPITALGILNLYIMERLQLAYFYKQPPLFGNKLNDKALQMMGYAPLVMVLFAYWQLGNRQQFHNEGSDIRYASMPAEPNHKPFDYSKGYDYTLLLLVFVPFFLFYDAVITGMQLLLTKVGLFK